MIDIEQSEGVIFLTLNQGKVTGDLATFAKSWLPYVSGCTSSTDPNGPKLGDGESTRVQ